MRGLVARVRRALRLRPAEDDLERLAVMVIWVGWLVVTALVAALLLLSYVVPGPVRTVLGMLGLVSVLWLSGPVLHKLTAPAARRSWRRVPLHVRTWLFGPLLFASVLTVLAVTVLPTDSARYVGLVYAFLVSVFLRVGLLVGVFVIAVRAVNRIPPPEPRRPRSGTKKKGRR
ncbi:MAG: hypothetical protein QOJ60_2186 [Actinomycetota bacterium]|jgi:hypothetical protein|nr:hypothetical protein [Actinomycetota bacterium]